MKSPFIFVKHIKQFSTFTHVDWDFLVDKALNPYPYNEEKTLSVNKANLPLVGAHNGKKKTLPVAIKSKFQHLRLDLDDSGMELETIIESIEKLGIERFIVHTSISHLQTNEEGVFKGNRYRLFIDLKDEIGVDDWKCLQHLLSEMFDADGCTDRPQQCVYLPCKTNVYDCRIGEGEPLDIEMQIGGMTLIEKARAAWEEKEKQEQADLELRRSKVRESQEYIDGTITPADFMRTIPMEEILERYGYKFDGHKRMWLSPNSTSGIAGGTVFINEFGDQIYYTFSESDVFHSTKGAIDQFEMIARMECSGSHEEAAHFVRDNIMPKHIVEQSDEAFMKSQPDYVDNSELQLSEEEKSKAQAMIERLKNSKAKSVSVPDEVEGELMPEEPKAETEAVPEQNQSEVIEGELMPEDEMSEQLQKAKKIASDSEKLAERIRIAQMTNASEEKAIEEAKLEASKAEALKAVEEFESACNELNEVEEHEIEEEEQKLFIPDWADSSNPDYDPVECAEMMVEIEDMMDAADEVFQDNSFITGTHAYDFYGREIGVDAKAYNGSESKNALNEKLEKLKEERRQEILKTIGFDYDQIVEDFELQGIEYANPPSTLGAICKDMYKCSFRPLKESYPLYGLQTMTLMAFKNNIKAIDGGKFGLMTCLIAESAAGKDTAQKYVKTACEILELNNKTSDKSRTDKDLTEQVLLNHSLMFIVDEAHTLLNQTGKGAAAYQQNLMPEIMKVLTDTLYIPSKKHANEVRAFKDKELSKCTANISKMEEEAMDIWESLAAIEGDNGLDPNSVEQEDTEYPLDESFILGTAQTPKRLKSLSDEINKLRSIEYNLKQEYKNVQEIDEVIERCKNGVKNPNVNFALASTPTHMDKGLVNNETMNDGFIGRLMLIRCEDQRAKLRPRDEIQKRPNHLLLLGMNARWELLNQKNITEVRTTGEAELLLDRIQRYFDADQYRNHEVLGAIYARLSQRVNSIASILGIGEPDGKVTKECVKWALVAVMRSICDINFMARESERKETLKQRSMGGSVELTPKEAVEKIKDRIADALRKCDSLNISTLKQRVFKPKDLAKFANHQARNTAFTQLQESGMLFISGTRVSNKPFPEGEEGTDED